MIFKSLSAALIIVASPVVAVAQSSAVDAARTQADSYNRDGAMTILSEACDTDDAAACRSLLAMLDRSYDDADEIKAREVAGRLCEQDDMLACVTLAKYARDGEGGDIDQPKQRSAFLSACELGLPSACVEAGKMLNAGDGGAQDKPGAGKLYDKGCAGGDAIACQYLGGYHSDIGWDTADKDAKLAAFTQGRAAFARACELGDAYSCTAIAEMLLEARGGEEDKTRAIELLDQACAMDFYQCSKRLEADRL